MLEKAIWNSKKPFPAHMLHRRRLNGDTSAKDTRHIEIDLSGSGISYLPGDALGVLAQNCPDLVGAVITALSADGDEAVVDADGNESTLREALFDHEINRIGTTLLRRLAEKTASDEIAKLLEPTRSEWRQKWSHGKDVLDVLCGYPGVHFTPQELVSCLKRLKPRLYSIASSLSAHPDQCHLCVGVVTFEAHGRRHKGVCSTWLGQRITSRDIVPSFIHVAKRFKLPKDPMTDIIMIGPGTGIAPFRAFLQERQVSAASGRNWLFFGDQHQASDFLYGDEIKAWHEDGLLERLDLAFSRDQDFKIYVQHRLWEQAGDLWAWIADGAHIYVCGDALRMAKDVDDVLHRIIREKGGYDTDVAKEYVKQMKKDGRYQRDVYAI